GRALGVARAQRIDGPIAFPSQIPDERRWNRVAQDHEAVAKERVNFRWGYVGHRRATPRRSFLREQRASLEVGRVAGTGAIIDAPSHIGALCVIDSADIPAAPIPYTTPLAGSNGSCRAARS